MVYILLMKRLVNLFLTCLFKLGAENRIFEGNAIHHQSSVDGSNEQKEVVPNPQQKDRLAFLIATWEASNMLLLKSFDDSLRKSFNISPSEVPRAPHLENCHEHFLINERLDAWGEHGTLPFWTLWKGQRFGLHMDNIFNTYEEDNTSKKNVSTQSLYPPWVSCSFVNAF